MTLMPPSETALLAIIGQTSRHRFRQPPSRAHRLEARGHKGITLSVVGGQLSRVHKLREDDTLTIPRRRMTALLVTSIAYHAV